MRTLIVIVTGLRLVLGWSLVHAQSDCRGQCDLMLTLRNSLSKDYKRVDKAGPGTLRLRVAITEAEGSSVPLDLVSTVIPQMRALSAVKRIATGTAAFVGKAGIEGEIEASITNQRLAAAVDRRVGQKRLQGVTNTWDDVQGAFDYWSERVRARLAEFRAGRGPT